MMNFTNSLFTYKTLFLLGHVLYEGLQILTKRSR